MNGRHQAAFAVDQTFLMQLELGNVGADGNKTAILRAAFIDLKPASVAELTFEGLATGAIVFIGHAALEGERARMGIDLVARHAGFQRPDGKASIFTELGIRHDEAIVGIPQDEGFRNILDGFADAHVGFRRLLRKAVLFADVESNADQMKIAFAGDFGANAHPHP